MTTMDDFDIYFAIYETSQQLHPLLFSYVHVKGHQDRHCPFHLLSWEAQLNVECDKHASRLLPLLLRHHQHAHPQLPFTCPNLYIHGQLVVRDFQHRLRYVACSPDYREYLCQKFQWKSSDCEEVNWLAFSFAFRRVNSNDQMRLHKFLHDWLPLNAAKHVNKPEEEQWCPSCYRHKEDFWHFLECPSPVRTTAFNKLRSSLLKLHQKYSVDIHLFQLLWEGLLSIRFSLSIDEQCLVYPVSLQNLFHKQQSIGWDQLFYGHIAVSWADKITADSKGSVSGTIFYSQVITIIWQYVLDVWRLRNADLHLPQIQHVALNVLEQQVQQLFHQIQSDPVLQPVAPTITIAQVLRRSPAAIQEWVHTTKMHVQQYLSAVNQQARLCTQDIRQFLINLNH